VNFCITNWLLNLHERKVNSMLRGYINRLAGSGSPCVQKIVSTRKEYICAWTCRLLIPKRERERERERERDISNTYSDRHG